MKVFARASAVFVVLGVLALAVAVPGISAANKTEDVRVVNGAGEPVPVTGTVNVGNEVSVAHTPFQTFASAFSSGSGEGCGEIEVPEGQAVMLQNLSVEANAPSGRPDVYLRITNHIGGGTVLDRITGELIEGAGKWSGFWDLDVLVDPPAGVEDGTSADICAGADGTLVSATATGYFE